jgi:hypothetical protein
MVANVASVMVPRPPIWIRIRMQIFPKRDQYRKVSWTTSPVTQIAEVEVKSASEKGVTTPAAEEIGSMSKKAPRRITARKLPIMI